MASSTNNEAESTQLTTGENDPAGHQTALIPSKPKACNATTNLKPFPFLHLDIVWMIMGLVHRSCILRLMESCRAFYSIGIPFLLRETIHMDEDNFQSFYNFLVMPSFGPSNRSKLLRDLRIHPFVCQSLPKMTLQILSGAVHLRTLEITFFPENAAELGKVLASLPDLCNVDVYLRGGFSAMTASRALRWLKRTQSHICTYGFFVCDTIDPPTLKGVIPIISSIAGTLTTLALEGIMFVPSEAEFVFPHVRTFRIEYSDGAFYKSLSPATLFKMFPNLDALHLPVSGITEDLGDDLLDVYVSRQQKAFDLGIHHRRLRTLEGSIYELSLGGYMCSVENLILQSSDQRWNGGTAEEPDYQAVNMIEYVASLGPFKELLFSLEFEYKNDTMLACIMRALPEALCGANAETIEIDCTMLADEESAYLRHEFNVEKCVLQIITEAPKVRTITIQTEESRMVRRETFDVPEDLLQRMRRTEGSTKRNFDQ